MTADDTAEPRAAGTPESTSALRQILERLLEDPHPMIADFAEAVRAIPSYGRGLVADDDVLSSAELALTVIGRTIIAASREGEIDLGNLPERVATSRASLRVSAEDLVDAIRLDFTVLWRHVLAEARPDELPSLAGEVELVWRVIDEYARQTRDRYQERVFAASLDMRASRQHHIGRLFAESRGVESAAVIAQAARALSLNATQRFVVCVIRSEGFDQLRRIELTLENLNARFFTWDRGADVVFFWPASGILNDRVARERLLQPIAHLPYGCVESVDGLQSVAGASDSARDLLDHAPADHTGACTIRDAWLNIATRAITAISPDLDGIIAQLATVPAGERGRIVSTLDTYFASGSIARTAELLFVHRNTIMNRLKRFEELTGVDPVRPADAALTSLILAQLREQLGEAG